MPFKPASGHLGGASRSGQIPEPTVIVRMKENAVGCGVRPLSKRDRLGWTCLDQKGDHI